MRGLRRARLNQRRGLQPRMPRRSRRRRTRMAKPPPSNRQCPARRRRARSRATGAQGMRLPGQLGAPGAWPARRTCLLVTRLGSGPNRAPPPSEGSNPSMCRELRASAAGPPWGQTASPERPPHTTRPRPTRTTWRRCPSSAPCARSPWAFRTPHPCETSNLGKPAKQHQG